MAKKRAAAKAAQAAEAAEYQLLMSRVRDFQELSPADEARLIELGPAHSEPGDWDEFFEISCYLHVRKDPVIAKALDNPNSILSVLRKPERKRKQ